MPHWREASYFKKGQGEMSHKKQTAVIASIGAAGLGAALMFFLDPNRGRQRREIVRDKASHIAKAGSVPFKKAARTLGNGNGLSHLQRSAAMRIALGATGGTLAYYGVKKRSPFGKVLSAVGFGLLGGEAKHAFLH
jgi:hypothetical protein